MASAGAATRLNTDERLMDEEGPAMCMAERIDGNIFRWKVTLTGEEDTPYGGRQFELLMTFPPNYPESPPTIEFVTKIYHINVTEQNKVCLLKLAQWKPAFRPHEVLFDICNMLRTPEEGAAGNQTAYQLYKTNKAQYLKNVQMWCERAPRA